MSILNKMFAEARVINPDQYTSISGGAGSAWNSTCSYTSVEGEPIGHGNVVDDSGAD